MTGDGGLRPSSQAPELPWELLTTSGMVSLLLPTAFPAASWCLASKWPCVSIGGRRRIPPAIPGSRASSHGVGPGRTRGPRRRWAARPALPAAPRSPCLDLPAPRPRRLGAQVRTRAGRRSSCSPTAALVSPNSAIVRGRAASSLGTPVVSSVHLAGSAFVWTTHVSLAAGDNRERGGRASKEVAQCAALVLPGHGGQRRQTNV